jgi:hypothetical protein
LSILHVRNMPFAFSDSAMIFATSALPAGVKCPMEPSGTAGQIHPWYRKAPGSLPVAGSGSAQLGDQAMAGSTRIGHVVSLSSLSVTPPSRPLNKPFFA